MKSLQITSSQIVVSANHLSPTGYYVSHQVKGILPGCRKNTDLSISPMAQSIWVKNLWSYNGTANVEPRDWAKLIEDSPVVSAKYSSTYPLTPEIIADAKAQALSITTCPAVTDLTHVREGYKPEYTALAVAPTATAVRS